MSYKYIIFSMLFALTACTTTNSYLKTAHERERFFFLKEAEQNFRAALKSSPSDSRGYMELARFFMRTGRHGKAKLLLHKASSLANAPAQVWHLLATCYLQSNQYKSARLSSERGLSLFPFDPALIKLRNRINFELLSTQCKNKIKKHPKQTAFRKVLAFSYLNRGFDNLAIIEFEKILDIEKRNSKLLLRLGNHFYKRKNFSKAHDYYTRLLYSQPKNAQALNALGEIALKRGYLWDAYRLFFKSAMYSPNNGKAFEKIGYMAIRMGKRDDAEKFLKRAVALGVRNAQIFSRLGHILLASSEDKNQSAAQHYFEKAENFLPADKQSIVIHAMFIKKINRLNQFISFFAGNKRKEAEIRFQLANCYLSLKKYRKAYAEISQAHAIQPNFFRYLLTKGRIEYKLQMLARCLESFKRCLNLNPAEKKLYLYLAKIYKTGPLKNIDKYIEMLEKGAGLKGPSPQFHKMLADHYFAKKEYAKALNSYILASKQGISTLYKKIKMLKLKIARAKLHKEGSNADSAEELLAIAQKFKKLEGNGSRAQLKYLEKAIKTEEAKKSAGYHTLLGEAYAAAFFRYIDYSHLKRAILHLKKASSLHPNHVAALSIRAQLSAFDWKTSNKKGTALLSRWGKLDIVTDPFFIKNKTALYKELPILRSTRFFSLGKIMFNKHKDPAAAEYLKKALSLSQKEALSITVALGAIYRAQHAYTKAAKFYKKLLNMRNKPAYKQYAVLFLLLGNLHASIAERLPYTPSYFRKKFALDGKITPEILNAIAKKITSAKKRAITYYQSYINSSGQIFTHRTKCRQKIAQLNQIPSDNAAIYRRIAKTYYYAGDKQKAAQILLAALHKTPANKAQKASYLFLAKLLAELGQTKKLTATYAVILKNYPNDWRNYYNFARYLFSKGEIKSSIENFEKASDLSRYDADIKSILGFLYWKSKQPAKAIKSLSLAVKIDKENLNAYYYMSKILLEAGETKKAIQHGEKVVSLFKENLPKYYGNQQKKGIFLDTLSMLARIAFYNKNIVKCLKYAYEGSSFDNNDRYHFLAMIGDICFLQKKYPQAEQYYKKAVSLNKKMAIFRYKLAQTYLKNNKTLQAKQLLENLYNNNRQFTLRADLHLVLAAFYNQRKQQEKCIDILNNLIEEFPYKQSGYIALADLLKKRNARQKALTTLEKGLSTIKNAPALRDALAWLLIEQHDTQLQKRALHLAMENASTHPDNANYRATLSYIYFKFNNFQQSRALFPNIKNARARRITFKKMINMDNAVGFFRAGDYKKAIDLISFSKNSSPTKKSLYTTRLFSFFLKQKRNALAN